MQARAMKSMMAVSGRQVGHHTISGNISLFQIHQKLKKVVQRLQPANFVTKPLVVATLWGRPVFGQTKAGIQSCIKINQMMMIRENF